MKKKNLVTAIFFILFIVGVILIRFKPVIFDFTIIHNLFPPNVLYHNNVMGLSWLTGIFSLLLTLLYGPLFCGYMCPFGTLQKILSHMATTIGIKKIQLKKLHKGFSMVKYLILGYFVFLILNDSVWTYINIDPYHAFIRLFYGGITLIGGGYLITIVLVSLFVERPFCNYLCPYGGGLNILSSMRVFRIHRLHDVCIQCKKCNKTCPVHIDITHKSTVNAMSCLSCHNCIDVCPKEGAIKKKNHLSGLLVSLVIMAAFIYISMPAKQLVGKENFLAETVETLEAPIVIEAIIVLKETSTVDVYYDHSIDIIPIELTKEKNAEAMSLYEQKLAAQLEAERITKEKAEADEVALKKAEANRIAEEALEAAGKLYYDGVYKATVNAFAPDMTVQVEIKNDKIISIEIIHHNESRSNFNDAAPKVIEKILGDNNTNIRIIAGSTYTSLGIRNGVRVCLSKAKR